MVRIYTLHKIIEFGLCIILEVRMFWEKYCELCKREGDSPNGIAAKLGFSNAACTKWKRGSVPGGASLSKIADYFGVGVDYLMGTKKEPVEALDPIDVEILQALRDLSVEDLRKVLEYANSLRGE